MISLGLSVNTSFASPTWTNINGSQSFSSLYDVAVDSSGNVYVVDNSVTIKIWNRTTGTWSEWSTSFTFTTPSSLTFDGSGNLYVVDSASGVYNIRKWTRSTDTWSTLSASSAPGLITKLYADQAGNLYATDALNSSVKKLVQGSSAWTDIGGSNFANPLGIVADSSGNVYVADGSYNKIKKLAANSSTWTDITGTATFGRPFDLDLDTSGHLYVTDVGSKKIMVLDLSTSVWTDITYSSVLSFPRGIAADISGHVYVVDLSNNRVQMLRGTVDAQTPTITAQPISVITQPEPSGISLEVTASITDGGTLSYQWYSNTVISNTGGTAIAEATRASYTAPVATVGKKYYYVVVTNTNITAGGSIVANVASDPVEVTVVGKGDANLDGKVNNADALLLIRYLNNQTSLTDEQKIILDMNNDKQLDTTDVKLILAQAVGK